MANIVNARDKNNNIVYPITKTSLVLDNNGTSVDILLEGKQDSLTSAQMTAANSGITSALVAQITTNATNIGTLQTDVSSLQTTVSNKMDKNNPTGTGSFSLNRLSSGTTGSYSSTLGRNNIASGINSHAAGYYTTAQRRSQQIFGEYNILDTTGDSTSSKGSFIEIVGNGTSTTNRSNARTLDWSGNETLAGTSTATGFKTPNGTSSQLLMADGNTIDYQSSQNDSANKIVQRDSNSDVLVPTTPSSNNGAASKSYVDRISDYSTNEVAIGKWIDGSTLYRKVLNYTTADTNQQWWNVENLDYLNIKAVIKIHGMISDGYNTNILPASEGQYYRNLRYSEETKWLQHINNGFNNASGYIAIEYTKN